MNALFPISEALSVFLTQNMTAKTYAKGEIVLKQGQQCQNLFFIKSGLMRGYFLSGKKEVTTWISCENELVTSISGFFNQSAAKETIQALEPTQVECLSYEVMHEALEGYPEFAKINRQLLEQYYLMAEERALLARIPNASERLKYFAQSPFAHLLARVPYKYLASLLAIRPETFSRLLQQV